MSADNNNNNQEEKDYLPFINGTDVPDSGLLCKVLKVRQFSNKKFTGYFVDVETPKGPGTLSLNSQGVLEHMVLQQLEGVFEFTIYPYKKDDKTYISTRKPNKSQQEKVSQSGPRVSKRSFGQ